MTTPSSTVKKVAATVGLLLGAFALSALANWTAPLSAPPNCVTDSTQPNYQDGCVTPINVGGSWQGKAGALSIGNMNQTSATLNVTGSSVLQSLGVTGTTILGGGGPAAGYVLKSTDSNGTTAWVDPATLPIGGGGGGGAIAVKIYHVGGDLGVHTYCAILHDQVAQGSLISSLSTFLTESNGDWTFNVASSNDAKPTAACFDMPSSFTTTWTTVN